MPQGPQGENPYSDFSGLWRARMRGEARERAQSENPYSDFSRLWRARMRREARPFRDPRPAPQLPSAPAWSTLTAQTDRFRGPAGTPGFVDPAPPWADQYLLGELPPDAPPSTGPFITPILEEGWSPPIEIAGRTGQINFDEPYTWGGTPGRRYPFHTEEGDVYNYQLEERYQGGRWEDAHHAEADYIQYQRMPYEVRRAHLRDMWGDDDPIAGVIDAAAAGNVPFEFLRMRLEPYNTHRQISGQEEPPGSRGRRLADLLAHQRIPEDRVPLPTAPPAPPMQKPEASWGDRIKDAPVQTARGILSAMEATVGLAEIVAPEFVRNMADDVLGEDRLTLSGARDIWGSYLSDAARYEQARSAEADTLGEAIGTFVENPWLLQGATLESLPVMAAGGVVGRGVMGAAAGLGRVLSPAAAGAIGEGAMSAGLSAASMSEDPRANPLAAYLDRDGPRASPVDPDQGVLTVPQRLAAVATGMGVSALGRWGAKFADELGFADVDTLVASVKGNPESSRHLVRSVLLGATQEALEELPQGVLETVIQNAATGRPLEEGVSMAAVLGTLSGAAMGAGAQGLQYAADRFGPEGTDTGPLDPGFVETPDLSVSVDDMLAHYRDELLARRVETPDLSPEGVAPEDADRGEDGAPFQPAPADSGTIGAERLGSLIHDVRDDQALQELSSDELTVVAENHTLREQRFRAQIEQARRKGQEADTPQDAVGETAPPRPALDPLWPSTMTLEEYRQSDLGRTRDGAKHAHSAPKGSYFHAATAPGATVKTLMGLRKQQLEDLAAFMGTPKSGTKEQIADRILKRFAARIEVQEATRETLNKNYNISKSASTGKPGLKDLVSRLGGAPYGNKNALITRVLALRDAARKHSQDWMSAARHRESVRRAIDRGDTLRPEVLALYPDLVPKATHGTRPHADRPPAEPSATPITDAAAADPAPTPLGPEGKRLLQEAAPQQIKAAINTVANWYPRRARDEGRSDIELTEDLGQVVFGAPGGMNFSVDGVSGRLDYKGGQAPEITVRLGDQVETYAGKKLLEIVRGATEIGTKPPRRVSDVEPPDKVKWDELTGAEAIELRRILTEMESVPFTEKTITYPYGVEGEAVVTPRSGGAPVYWDIIRGSAKGGADFGHYSRGQIIDAIQRLIQGGGRTVPSDLAVETARARLGSGDLYRGLSRPLFDAGSGSPAVQSVDVEQEGREVRVANPVPRLEGLSPAAAEVQEKVANRTDRDLEQLVAEYRAANGNYFNADTAKTLFPEYNRSNETRAAYGRAVHTSASRIAHTAFRQALEEGELRFTDDSVVMTGGGTGSGKTTTLEHALGDLNKNAHAVYDSTLSDYDGAASDIQAALDNGLSVGVIFVVRDVIAAYRDGVLPRQAATGRTVTIDEHLSTHRRSRETFQRLADEFADTPNVSFEVVDNRGDHQRDAYSADLSLLKETEYDEARVRETLRALSPAQDPDVGAPETDQEGPEGLAPSADPVVAGESPQESPQEAVHGEALDPQAPAVDTLDTGEGQPRLPDDVGEVRDAEDQPTPGVSDAPFSLTSPVAEAGAPPQVDLLADQRGSAEYQAALERFRKEAERHAGVTAQYRAGEVDDDVFLASRRQLTLASAEVDRHDPNVDTTQLPGDHPRATSTETPSAFQRDESRTDEQIRTARNEQNAIQDQTNESTDPTPETAVKPIDEETAADVLSRHGMTVEQTTTKTGRIVWEVKGKTFDNKDALKKAGAKRYGPKKAWSFWKEADLNRFAGTLATGETRSDREGDADDAGPGRDGAPDLGIVELRQREDARADRRATSDDLNRAVDDQTRELIARGRAFGIPEDVLDEQIEDIGSIVTAFEADMPMFMLANEAGTGKTFVLGGVIRELAQRGVRKVVYVTLNQDLIAQNKKDLADYGVDHVQFVTYADLSKNKGRGVDIDDGVLLLDEAHSVKNDGSARGVVAQGLMEQARMTVMASATPFENPVEAGFLYPTGVFGGTTLKDKKQRFIAWVKAYGAHVRKVRTAPGEFEEYPYWQGGKKEDGAAARQWFVKQGIFRQAAKRLPAGMADSSFVATSVSDEWVRIYQSVEGVYAAAMQEWRNDDGSPKNPKIFAMLSAHRMNTIKRILEASKLQEGIRLAQEQLDQGRAVVIFTETKADRALGRFRQTGKRKASDPLYDYLEISDAMQAWNEAARAAKAMGEKVPAPPFSQVVTTLAKHYWNQNVNFELPSTSDELVSGLGGKDAVAIYTGGVTPAVAQRNKADFLAGRKKVLIATMAKGGTGLSLHDTTGDRPTTQLNINLPWKASQVDQVSGRVARYGMQSKADVIWVFADNIPFEAVLSQRVGQRMRDMGALVKGLELQAAEALTGDWDMGKEQSVAVSGERAIRLDDRLEDIYTAAERRQAEEGGPRRPADTSGDFFPTPYSLAALMTQVSGVRAGQRVLEPSVGTGRLLWALPEGVELVTVEQRGDLTPPALGAETKRGDFLTVADDPDMGTFDTILMNPPFSKSADAKHVQRAAELLGKEGRLVAVMGEGVFFREKKADAAFREWLEERGALVVRLPQGTFKTSGTDVSTRLVIIDQGADAGRTDIELASLDQNALREVESAIPPRASSRGVTPADTAAPPALTQRAQSAIDRVEQAAKDRLNNRGTFSGRRPTAGLPVDDLADIAIIGAAKIARGTTAFAAWSSEMIRDFGEVVVPHLKALYDEAKKRAVTLVDDTLTRAPVFYSSLERSIEALMPTRATAKQTLNIARKSGISQEELDWSGLESWLASQSGSVSKEDVLGYLVSNQVTVSEVAQGAMPPAFFGRNRFERTYAARAAALTAERSALLQAMNDDPVVSASSSPTVVSGAIARGDAVLGHWRQTKPAVAGTPTTAFEVEVDWDPAVTADDDSVFRERLAATGTVRETAPAYEVYDESGLFYGFYKALPDEINLGSRHGAQHIVQAVLARAHEEGPSPVRMNVLDRAIDDLTILRFAARIEGEAGVRHAGPILAAAYRASEHKLKGAIGRRERPATAAIAQSQMADREARRDLIKRLKIRDTGIGLALSAPDRVTAEPVTPDAKYKSYTLPHGENYRILLLTLDQQPGLGVMPVEFGKEVSGRDFEHGWKRAAIGGAVPRAEWPDGRVARLPQQEELDPRRSLDIADYIEAEGPFDPASFRVESVTPFYGRDVRSETRAPLLSGVLAELAELSDAVSDAVWSPDWTTTKPWVVAFDGSLTGKSWHRQKTFVFETRIEAEEFITNRMSSMMADPVEDIYSASDMNDPRLFRDGHFGEYPGVLAHVRFTERRDTEGRRVLFVEEVQSDWHQEGRKRGYQEPRKIDTRLTDPKVVTEGPPGMYDVRTENGDLIGVVTREDLVQEWIPVKLQFETDRGDRIPGVSHYTLAPDLTFGTFLDYIQQVIDELEDRHEARSGRRHGGPGSPYDAALKGARLAEEEIAARDPDPTRSPNVGSTLWGNEGRWTASAQPPEALEWSEYESYVFDASAEMGTRADLGAPPASKYEEPPSDEAYARISQLLDRLVNHPDETKQKLRMIQARSTPFGDDTDLQGAVATEDDDPVRWGHLHALLREVAAESDARYAESSSAANARRRPSARVFLGPEALRSTRIDTGEPLPDLLPLYRTFPDQARSGPDPEPASSQPDVAIPVSGLAFQQLLLKPLPTTSEGMKSAAIELAEEQFGREHDPLRHRIDRSKPPDAPFKTTWPELAMKRMIRYAAEGDFEVLAWTTGEQQVDRYNSALRNAVDRVRWEKTPDGIHLVGEKRRRDDQALIEWSPVVDTTQRENMLSDVIGKAMAEQILSSPDQTGTIEGDDIAIAEAWPALFYDRMLPSFMKKYGKKWGSSVRDVEVSVEDEVPSWRQAEAEVEFVGPLLGGPPFDGNTDTARDRIERLLARWLTEEMAWVAKTATSSEQERGVLPEYIYRDPRKQDLRKEAQQAAEYISDDGRHPDSRRHFIQEMAPVFEGALRIIWTLNYAYERQAGESLARHRALRLDTDGPGSYGFVEMWNNALMHAQVFGPLPANVSRHPQIQRELEQGFRVEEAVERVNQMRQVAAMLLRGELVSRTEPRPGVAAVSDDRPTPARERVHGMTLTEEMRQSVLFGGQSRFGRTAATAIDLLDRVKDGAQARIKDRGTFKGGRLHSGLPVEDAADLAIIGAAKLAKGTVKFTQWSAEMLAEFGTQIQPYLRELFTEANRRLQLMKKFSPDDYFNFDRVAISPDEEAALRAAITETVVRTGRVPKERTTFDEIRADARALLPGNVGKYLARFVEAQAPFRAVRHVVRERINTINQEIVQARKAIGHLPDELVLEAERDLERRENDRRALLDVWMRMRSEDGRNLAMHRMTADTTWDSAYWFSRAKRSMGLPSNVDLPLKVYQKINELLDAGNTATTDAERIEAKNQLALYVTELDKTGWLEALSMVRKAGLLTGIKTHLRNLGGNLSFQILEELSRVPAAALDLMIAQASKSRTVQGIAPMAVARATYNAATKGVQEALSIMRHGTGGHELLKVGASREMNTGIRWLDSYVNFVFRTMSAEDRLFKSYAFRRSLEEQAALEAINRGVAPMELLLDPPTEMVAQAIADAEFATFNNRSIIGGGLRQMQAAVARTGTAGEAVSFAIDIAVPFANTPANILSRILDYTPVGSGVKATAAITRAMANKALSPDEQRAFTLAVGRGMTGTALMYFGWKLAAAGLATGVGGEDEGDRNVQRAAGRLNGSVRVGGHWHVVAPFSPGGNLLTLGASLHRQATRPGDRPEERAANIAGVLGRLMMEQPMLRGITDVQDFLQGQGQAPRVASRTMGSFVPTLVNDAAALFDPYRRDARPDGMREMLYVGVQARLPWLRNALPRRVDVLGRFEDQGKAALWNPTLAIPAREMNDAVIRALLDHDVGVGFVNRREDETREAHQARITATGKAIDLLVGRVLANGALEGRSMEERRQVLDRVISRARTLVNQEIRGGGALDDLIANVDSQLEARRDRAVLAPVAGATVEGRR